MLERRAEFWRKRKRENSEIERHTDIRRLNVSECLCVSVLMCEKERKKEGEDSRKKRERGRFLEKKAKEK